MVWPLCLPEMRGGSAGPVAGLDDLEKIKFSSFPNLPRVKASCKLHIQKLFVMPAAWSRLSDDFQNKTRLLLETHSVFVAVKELIV
jgi:hypothetical protein